MLGVSKDGDTVGLFQESSDPKQAKNSISKVIFLNKTKGLSSAQNLAGKVISRAEFQNFRITGWDANSFKLQSAIYFITETDAKKRALSTLWPG